MINLDIIGLIKNIPFFGVIAYKKDEIIYVNKGAIEILGYSEDEFKKISLNDIFFNEPEIEKNSFEWDLKRKNGALVKCQLYFTDLNDIKILIFFNISVQKFLEKAYHLIGNINSVLNLCEDEKTFIKRILNEVKDIYEADDVEIAEFSEGKLYSTNKFFINCVEKQDVIAEILKNKIVFIYNKVNECKYSSVCLIPLKKGDKIRYVLGIFSKVPEYFNLSERRLLEEVKEAISFGLDKIEKEKNIKILYSALENSPDWVLITDKNGTIIYVNKTVERLSKYSKQELIGNNPKILKSGFYDKKFYEKMWTTLKSGKPFSCVIINKDKFGNFFKVEHLIIPVKIGNKIEYFVALGKDLTREEKLEGEVYRLKFYDILTGVLNRYGFIFEVQRKVNEISEGKVGGIFVLDIYNFSYLNKVFSNKIGDILLKEVASLLERLIPDGVVSRTGGDEFSFFTIVDGKDIISFLQSIVEIFKVSKFTEKNLNIDINIGVSFYERDGVDINELINNARTALNIAKEKGPNRFAIFNKDIEKIIIKERESRNLIVNAYENNWFEVYLQPYFYAESLKLAGFESLLRINHPEKGIITPYFFIEALESSEFIFEVEKSIISKIIETIIFWSSKGYEIKPISVNLTARSFAKKDIIDFIVSKVKDLKENFLNVEITERMLVNNPEYAKEVVKILQKQNIKILLDDFGTGYSSLSYLTEIPVDYLKIDISFIRKFLVDERTYQVVEIIIDLAKKLNMKTIAEGVEKDAQLNELRKLGCDIIQGFLFAKPIPIKSAEKYLSRN